MKLCSVLVALFAFFGSSVASGNPCDLPGLPNFSEGIGGTGVTPVDEGLGGTGIPLPSREGVGGTGRRADIEGIGGTGVRPDDGGIGGTGKRAQSEGVGGTGQHFDSEGIGGTGVRSAGEILVHGVVTGFASICINGIEIHYDSQVPVVLDEKSTTVAELAVGQVVTVLALRGNAGLQARRIFARSEVVGEVTALDRRSGKLSVLSQRVSFNAQQGKVFGLALGLVVRISGLRDPNGDIRATRVEPVDQGVDSSITGMPEVLGERLVLIGGLRIVLPAGVDASALNGAEWRFSGRVTANALIARRIQAAQASSQRAEVSIAQAVVESVGKDVVRFTGGPQLHVNVALQGLTDLPNPGDVMTYAADRVDDHWQVVDFAIQVPDDIGDRPDEKVPPAVDGPHADSTVEVEHEDDRSKDVLLDDGFSHDDVREQDGDRDNQESPEFSDRSKAADDIEKLDDDEVSELPEVPDQLEEPETPEELETPEEVEEPEAPEEPEVPDEIEAPEALEEPETPEEVEEPEAPEVPEVPDEIEEPEAPEELETPEEVEAPEAPEVPETLEEVEEPEVPEVPEAPEEVDEPETPEVPEELEEPEVPELDDDKD